MTIYDYDKSPVDISSLTEEISDAGIAAPQYCTYNAGEEPYNLHIAYADELDPADVTTLDGVVAAHQGTVTPDATQQTAQNLENMQTSETSWQDVLVLTTPVFPPGTYLIEWSAELRSSKSDNECDAQVLIDGESDPIFEGGHDRKSWVPCSGFAEVEMTGIAVRTVRFQYRKSPNARSNAAAYVRRTTLRIRPV